MCFRLLSGIRWLIAGEGGITTSPWCIFQKYIRYSLHKTVSIIRGYFSFNTGLRIGNTFIFIIIFAKVKTLHHIFPSLSSDSSIGAFKVGRSALNEGAELLQHIWLICAFRFQLFLEKFGSSKAKQEGIFPRMLYMTWTDCEVLARFSRGWCTPKVSGKVFRDFQDSFFSCSFLL